MTRNLKNTIIVLGIGAAALVGVVEFRSPIALVVLAVMAAYGFRWLIRRYPFVGTVAAIFALAFVAGALGVGGRGWRRRWYW
jgi:hypothetical protein